VAAFKAQSQVPLPASDERLRAFLGNPTHQALAASFAPVRERGPASSPVAEG
jgi:hypothetical protein